MTRRSQGRRTCLHSPGESAKHGLALGIVECQLYQPEQHNTEVGTVSPAIAGRPSRAPSLAEHCVLAADPPRRP
jgi:hypothetical protein